MNQPNHEVTIEPDGVSLHVEHLALLTETLSSAGILITVPCAGNGTCGKCKVQVEGTCQPLTTQEQSLLSPEEQAQGVRLACQAQVMGDVTLTIPEASRTNEMRIMLSGSGRSIHFEPCLTKRYVECPSQSLEHAVSEVANIREVLDLRADLKPDLATSRLLADALHASDRKVTLVLHDARILGVEAGDTTDSAYGLALDIGTTTVVGALIDLHDGREVAIASSVNEQAQYGHDVISRILHTIEKAEGLDQLRAAVMQSVKRVLQSVTEKAGISSDQIYEVTVAGNTTMAHLFAGIHPRTLGTLPYVPVISDAINIPASDLEMPIHSRGTVHLLPNIAGFVGADTVAAILAASFDEDDGRIRMLADIGTNCEIVLRKGDQLLAASTPAGPAFEGARITHGMYALPGAIERIQLDGDCSVKVIGQTTPKGICGSGLVDAGAELLRVGLIDMMGRMLEPSEVDGNLAPCVRERLIEDDMGSAFILANGEVDPITLTQRDMRELQLAKGAIRTGIDALLQHAGVSLEDLDELCLAGGFGSYINKGNAIRLGLIPNLDEERITYIGNAALVGSKLVLVSRQMRRRAMELINQVVHLQVAHTPEFQMAFAEAMLFENAVV